MLDVRELLSAQKSYGNVIILSHGDITTTDIHNNLWEKKRTVYYILRTPEADERNFSF